MEPNIFDKIHDIDLKKTMEKFGYYAEILYRLRHERYRFQGSSGCKGRFKAGSAKSSLLHDRVKQRSGQATS